MKKFNIVIDVKMSGDLEIEANSEKEARAKAMAICFTPYDLRNFHFLNSEIYESEEIEEDEPELVPMPVNKKAQEEYNKRFGIKE